MKIFDYHVHSHNPVDFTSQFNITPDVQFKKPHDYIHDHTKNLDENALHTVEEYDNNQIEKGLISGPNNDYWIEKYPDRFLNSFRFPLNQNPEDFVGIFEEGIRTDKIYALGELGLSYAGLRLDTELLYPLYEVCEKYAIPVMFHTGLNGPQSSHMMPHWKIDNGNPIHLEPVLGSFPELICVMAHFGYPFIDQTNYILATYKNTYTDVSVVNWMLGEIFYHRILGETVDNVGSERILYGSDQMVWPQNITKSVERTKAAPIPVDDLENIFYNNAVKLLKLSD